MNVFISWSWPRGRLVAEALCDWLPKVVQTAKPWMSPDIDKGNRWVVEMETRLEEAQLGVICLTADSLGSRWVHYEAGRIAKSNGAKICTFLCDVKHNEVEFPLAQFQHTSFEKGDVEQLVAGLNGEAGRLGENQVSSKVVTESVAVFWQQLDERLRKIPEHVGEQPKRGDQDILNEILTTVRQVVPQMQALQVASPAAVEPIRAQAPRQTVTKYWFKITDKSQKAHALSTLAAIGRIDFESNTKKHVLVVRTELKHQASIIMDGLKAYVRRTAKPLPDELAGGEITHVAGHVK